MLSGLSGRGDLPAALQWLEIRIRSALSVELLHLPMYTSQPSLDWSWSLLCRLGDVASGWIILALPLYIKSLIETILIFIYN